MGGLRLYRYGSSGPVVVGVPVAGRPAGQHAMIAGLCTNTVPIAVAVDPGQPLDQLVRGVREQLLAGVGNGLYPLARAVEAVRPSRAPGRMPLVETLITVQESPLREIPGLMAALAGQEWIDLGPLRLRSVTVPRRTCRYDLDLVVTPCGAGRYLLSLDYAAQLFEPETAEGILRTYMAMVAAAVRADAVTVADVFVLPEEQRELYRMAGHSRTDAAPPLVASLVRDAADRAPAAAAVVTDGLAISYAELRSRIDQLSSALATLTGQPSRHVGLLIEPSADFVVSMLGAWSAGIGILPLPIEFPDARLRAMVEDRRPAALVASATQAQRARQLASGLPEVGVLDLTVASVPRGSAFPRGAHPDHPAYTVYTSGSTGKPKGVQVRQGQVAELVAWEAINWKLGPGCAWRRRSRWASTSGCRRSSRHCRRAERWWSRRALTGATPWPTRTSCVGSRSPSCSPLHPSATRSPPRGGHCPTFASS